MPARVIEYAILAVAVVLLLVSLSIHIVMPTAILAIVRLVAAEVTPWLVVLGLVTTAVAVTRLGSGWPIASLAAGVAALAIVLAAFPLARAPGVVADADRQLRDAFGVDVPGQRPALSLLTSFAGQRVPGVSVERDIAFDVVDGSLRLDRYAGAGDDRARPAIVVVHGGSWRSGDKGETALSNTEWSRAFASRGFVVYDVQYRLTPAVRHPVPMNDVLCALAHVRARAGADRVDPTRVVLIGRSAGAHLALLAAYRSHEAPCGTTAGIAGVVALYGPTDLIRGYEIPADPDLIDGRAALRDLLGGPPDAVRDRYVDATPQTWVASAVPTLLLHGGADQIVYPRHSEDLAARLRERGVPVVYLRFPWSGHGFDMISVGVGGQIALAATERFVDQVVNGLPSGDRPVSDPAIPGREGSRR
jgi:acetyl esterase/lipase